jgi:predicted  nucleic acid-binding Zn-ribbon protein
VTCPKCGHEYSSQYPACSKCGTNRQKYRDEELERIRKDILKRDREKKKREEWLKTPEGQAALKKEQDELRRRAEEAKRKRKEEEDRKRQEVEQETKMFNTIGLIVTALIALLVILGLLIDMNK